MAIKEIQPNIEELEQVYLLDTPEVNPKKRRRQQKKLAKKAIAESKKPIQHDRFLKSARIGAAALMGLVAFVNTDKALGQAVWNGNETKAHMLSEYEGKTSDNVWMIIPGLGVQSGEGIASVENATLNHTGSVGYMDFSDDGVDTYDAAMEITEVLDEQHAKSISFYDHSMGGDLMSEILKYLPSRFDIKFVVLDCSPSWIYDAKNSFSPKASRPAGMYGGGLLSKFGFELWNNTILHKNNDLSLLEQINDAKRVTMTGSSPRLFTNELDQLGRINISDTAARLRTAEAIFYEMPEDPNADETVYTREAYEGWKTKIGANIVKIIVKNSGHADDTDKPGEHAEALFPYLVLPYQESNQIEDKRRN